MRSGARVGPLRNVTARRETASDESALRRGEPTLWRPISNIALFSVLPFTTFLADNTLEADISGGFAFYPLLLFVPGAAALLVAKRSGGLYRAERYAVVFAVATFMLFKFLAIQRSLPDLGLPAEYPPAFAVWLALSVCVVLATVRLSRSPLSWTFVMVAGAFLVAASTWQYAFAANRVLPAEAAGQIPAAVQGAQPAKRPDVWFFLLDGYGRADVLADEVGYDSSRFFDQLRERGFSVEPAAAASYPRTVPSLATTLAMDYTLTEDDMIPRGLHMVVRGDNATVRSFRELGYQYVAATDYALLECDEFADVCLYPRAGADLGSRDQEVLKATPIQKPLARLQNALSGEELENVLAPDEVVRAVERSRPNEPIFVYAHLLAPHPPYRFGRDCSRVEVDKDNLTGWTATREFRDRYANDVGCLNAVLVKAVDAILADRPDSIIIFQGDHGPGFKVPLNTPPNDWSDAELRQRYSILSALRPGPSCRKTSRAPVVPVNTFRVVLSCVTGRRISELPPRRYSAAYGESALDIERLRPVDFRPRP